MTKLPGFLIFSSVLMLAVLSGCDNDVTCDDISCDSNTEFCVYFGSDTDEPSTSECYDLPDPCFAGPECSCLEGEDVGNFGLPWCLDEGGCDMVDGVLQVVCPGG